MEIAFRSPSLPLSPSTLCYPPHSHTPILICFECLRFFFFYLFVCTGFFFVHLSWVIFYSFPLFFTSVPPYPPFSAVITCLSVFNKSYLLLPLSPFPIIFYTCLQLELLFTLYCSYLCIPIIILSLRGCFYLSVCSVFSTSFSLQCIIDTYYLA
jgi:hypothetical protein